MPPVQCSGETFCVLRPCNGVAWLCVFLAVSLQGMQGMNGPGGMAAAAAAPAWQGGGGGMQQATVFAGAVGGGMGSNCQNAVLQIIQGCNSDLGVFKNDVSERFCTCASNKIRCGNRPELNFQQALLLCLFICSVCFCDGLNA